MIYVKKYCNLHVLDEGELREERPDFNSDFSTAFIYNPYKNQAIDIQRKRLPIFQYREHVMFLLERHQIIILIGETGSGKSTQVNIININSMLFKVF